MEDLDTYRAICANRIRRLERYRKAKSFCSLDTSNNTITPSTSPTQPPSTFDLIREKMFSLMENDMSLLQQLLTLGDQINEIKKERMRRAQSHNSVSYDEEDEDKFDAFSAVTNLYVDDDQPQFFSRQNSVLRIPIPPRSSNRFGTRRVIRCPSDVQLPRHQQTIPRVLHVNSDDSDGSERSLSAKNRSSSSSIDSGIREDPSFESAVI